MSRDNLRTLSAPEKTIRFLDYLRKNTDENHTVQLKDIKAAFREMGLNPGVNNTLHDFIVGVANACNADVEESVLPQAEWRVMFDDYIEKYGEQPVEDETDREWMQIRNLYYVPEFSYKELDALIEAVRFSRTLTAKEAEKIIKTLEEKFASKYYKRGVRGICKVHEKAGYDRDLLRKNLLTIQQAIEDGVQIEYQFNGYSHHKKLEPAGRYKRKASPYYIVADNGKYYLLAANERYKSTMILRIDLMTEVLIPERNETTGKKGIQRIPPGDVAALPQDWDVYYPMKHIHMSYDEPVRIKLRIKSRKEPDNPREHVTPDYTFLYDCFGDNYRYLGVDKEDSDYDIVSVECSPFGMTNFALQYADRLEVLEPAHIREEIQKKVRLLQNKYMV